MAARIDAVSARVQTAMAMKDVRKYKIGDDALFGATLLYSSLTSQYLLSIVAQRTVTSVVVFGQ